MIVTITGILYLHSNIFKLIHENSNKKIDNDEDLHSNIFKLIHGASIPENE